MIEMLGPKGWLLMLSVLSGLLALSPGLELCFRLFFVCVEVCNERG